ncbi:hypothetical protein GCM10009839_38890 [Catenulispora yoronensis]|uniref:Uncharacterized protein n=1 Tax=Catenulispora yoronensis TaxID=450799 RepID=A0ABN2UJP9_9ACTN
MTGPIRYRGVVIEDVPGAPWMVAYGWRDNVNRHFAVMRACPSYSSDELRLACWDSLVATVYGTCDLCGAVASTPAEAKVEPSDGSGFTGRCLLAHRDGCSCSDERLEDLDRRDSPDGQGTPPDYSDQSVDVLAAFLTMATEAST